MRGYRTLRGRFKLIGSDPSLALSGCAFQYVVDVTVGGTQYTAGHAEEYITLLFYGLGSSVAEEPTRHASGPYNMTILEAERLINFLDAAILEHRERLKKKCAQAHAPISEGTQ